MNPARRNQIKTEQAKALAQSLDGLVRAVSAHYELHERPLTSEQEAELEGATETLLKYLTGHGHAGYIQGHGTQEKRRKQREKTTCPESVSR